MITQDITANPNGLLTISSMATLIILGMLIGLVTYMIFAACADLWIMYIKNKKKNVRYRDQPWYLKTLLVIRYKTPVPIYTIISFIRMRMNKKDLDEEEFTLPNSLSFAWSIQNGLADVKMYDVIPMEEVFASLRMYASKINDEIKELDGKCKWCDQPAREINEAAMIDCDSKACLKKTRKSRKHDR